MLKRLRTHHQDALTRLFAIIRADPNALAFHPHGFEDRDAELISCYTGNDIYAGYFDQGVITAYGMLRGIDEGFDVPSLGVYVSPAARGQGVSLAVMEGLHALAQRDLGASKVRLKVYADNVRALRLYKKIGYQFETARGGELIGYFDLNDQTN